MAMWELALLFPPVARFFIGLLLIIGIVGGEALFAFFIYTKYYDKD
jgi:uncharacterized protein YneF (UPF0154 family)